MNYLRMDLKVCEGCGALWLRANLSTPGPVSPERSHAAGIYCRRCVRTLAQYPTSRVARGRRPARVRIRTHQPLAAVAAASALAGGAR